MNVATALSIIMLEKALPNAQSVQSVTQLIMRRVRRLAKKERTSFARRRRKTQFAPLSFAGKLFRYQFSVQKEQKKAAFLKPIARKQRAHQVP